MNIPIVISNMLKTILYNCKKSTKYVRQVSIAAETKESSDRIKAWQVHSYGEDLQCCSIRNPVISSPTDVLIKVEAASLNSLDVLMKDGYGRTMNKLFKCSDDIVLPITLGRDFSGVIVDKGHAVNKEFQAGDKVYGVIPFHKQGSHAEYTLADESHIMQHPCDLTHTEAAAIPYTALTAYSALWFTGGLFYKNPKGMKVLILGCSGGVGTCAIQMLRAVGSYVVGTCATDAVPLIQGIGADCVFDYKDPDYVANVASQGRYDIILDCAQIGYNNVPASWQFNEYITLNSPVLKNTDEYGLLAGLAMSAANLIPSNIISLSQGRCVKWAYFYPFNDGLKFIDKLIRNSKLVPVIYKTYKFEETPEAFCAMKAGHLRGKIVIDMLEDDCENN